MNPADDATFTRPLAKALQRHAEQLTPPGPVATDAVRAEPAVTWVYLTALIAWAEDHNLTQPWLRAPARTRQDAYLAGCPAGASGWLAHAAHDLASHHPATWCLLDPRYSRLAGAELPEDACRELLHWWAEEAPSLRYDVAAGPGSLSGWVPGWLLEQVSTRRKAGNALVQTPWWVADFILDLTLRPAAHAFPGTTLRLLDPCCGTGHFLVRAVERLFELYTTGAMTPYTTSGDATPEPIPGWDPCPPAEAVRRILGGLDGVELDPLTAAVARLRVTVAAASKLAGDRPFSLARVPQAIRPRIIVGDSLMLGVASREAYRKTHPGLYEIYTSEEELFGRVAWPGDGEPAPPPAGVAPRAAEQLDLFAQAP